jgi:hypothetical protein
MADSNALFRDKFTNFSIWISDLIPDQMKGRWSQFTSLNHDMQMRLFAAAIVRLLGSNQQLLPQLKECSDQWETIDKTNIEDLKYDTLNKCTLTIAKVLDTMIQTADNLLEKMVDEWYKSEDVQKHQDLFKLCRYFALFCELLMAE